MGSSVTATRLRVSDIGEVNTELGMESRSIGSLSVSLVGLGCNNFARKIDQEQSTEVVNAALESGITHFDTADRYGYGDHPYSGEGNSEVFLSKALGSRRPTVTIGTKFGIALDSDPVLNRGGSRRWVMQACEDSLRRLRTDYIDLYQIHNPDPDTPLEETLGALTDLVAAGKVREIGCSGYSGEQLTGSVKVSSENDFARYASAMHDYSLIVRAPEEELLPACRRLGIAFLPYFPLASGLLTGKYTKGRPAPAGSRLEFWTPRPSFALNDDNLERVQSLADFANVRGRTILELAMSWLAGRPEIASVIAGATTAEQVRENATAAGWKLSSEERTEIDEL